jgi:hypothetical protein
MPYATVSHNPSATMQEYRTVQAALGEERPDGLLFSVVGQSEAGMHVEFEVEVYVVPSVA